MRYGMGIGVGLLWIVALALPLAADAEKSLDGTLATDHFSIRYRMGSRAGASAELAAVRAETSLQSICDELGLKNDGKFRLFLYDNVAELQAVTGVGAGTGGFASGTDVHVPHDNLQTLAHEICHVVTARLSKAGKEPRSMFFVEGIANAMLRHVHGVSIHAVAKYYRVTKQLPPLSNMTSVTDFYAWLRKRPRFNGYDVAASYMRYVLDKFGAKRTLRYYTGASAKSALGKTEKQLEAGWHAALDKYELRAEVEALLRLRHGGEGAFTTLAEGDRAARSEQPAPDQLFDLTEVAIHPERGADWNRVDGQLHGVSAGGDWSWCALGNMPFGDAVLCATLHVAAGTAGVGVRLGDAAQGLFNGGRAFLYTSNNVSKGVGEKQRAPAGTVELLLVRQGHTLEIWIDGEKCHSAKYESPSGIPAIGVAQGTVTVRRVWLVQRTQKNAAEAK